MRFSALTLRRTCFWAGFALLLPSVGIAQKTEVKRAGTSKPVWRWSVAERFAARFDPSAMASREAEHQAEQEALRLRWGGSLLPEEEAKTADSPALTERIDGSKAPELFLPMELFGLLLNRGFPQGETTEIQVSRGSIEERAVALGFGRDLWERLGKAAAPYLRSLRGMDGQQLQGEKNDLRLCSLRAQALEAAKIEFGEEAFLRLLYQAVAPTARPVYVLTVEPLGIQKHAEHLLFLERGCQ